MRSDLEILEQIDLYLGGKMSATEAAAFKAKIAADPELQSMVSHQELLIQTVNRQAMMAELNSIAGAAGAAGAGATGWGITQWALTAIITSVTAIGGYFIYDHFNAEETVEIAEQDELPQNDLLVENTVDTGDFISFELAEATDEYENELDAYQVEKEEDETEHVIHNFENPELIEPEKIVNEDPIKVNTDGPLKLVKDPANNETVISNANQKASYPGGLVKMKSFISKNLMYPRTPKDKGLQGTVKVYFLISAEGKISHVESDCFIMKDKSGKPLSSGKMIANIKSQKYFEKNAERLFRTSSPWDPATDSHGNPIVSGQTWYVNFDYYGQSSAYQLEHEAPKKSACDIQSEADWEKVDVQTMKMKSQPKKFELIGESMININQDIKNVEDLSDAQYLEICKLAAKYKACTVFLDVNDFWDVGEGKIYFYFGSFKE